MSNIMGDKLCPGKFFLLIFNASILPRSWGTNSDGLKVEARNRRLGCGPPTPNDLIYQSSNFFTHAHWG